MEYSIDDILAAKEVVRNAGYGVSLPDNKLDIAKNIAKANGYTVRKAEAAPKQPAPAADINTALRVATDAGYTVRKAPTEPVSRPAPKPVPNVPPTPATPAEPASAATPAPAAAPTPAPAKPAEPVHEPSWVEKIASRYI